MQCGGADCGHCACHSSVGRKLLTYLVYHFPNVIGHLILDYLGTTALRSLSILTKHRAIRRAEETKGLTWSLFGCSFDSTDFNVAQFSSLCEVNDYVDSWVVRRPHEFGEGKNERRISSQFLLNTLARRWRESDFFSVTAIVFGGRVTFTEPVFARDIEFVFASYKKRGLFVGEEDSVSGDVDDTTSTCTVKCHE